ncbi:MAG: S-methyl-5-thioribose-1-phosphate isomerase [Syntrophaceae bacterium]
MIKPFRFQDNAFFILDQRRLPIQEHWLTCRSAFDVSQAIQTLAVRGAPAIGIAAAYGIVLAAQSGVLLEDAAKTLISARPTAVNLAWAVKRVMAVIDGLPADQIFMRAKKEADDIWEEEIQANAALSALGADLFAEDRPYSILTHCNPGTLATGGMGSALGVIRELSERGRVAMVYVDETRPLLQGARLTAYELKKDDIPATLIADNMAGWLMHQHKVDAVITGADRIAVNLDTANKIGTYSLAVLAKAHKVPFYIAAPMSTFDPDCPSGKHIPIEERHAAEVKSYGGTMVAADIPAFNPSFDVTPHRLITAVITEKKIFKP